MLQRVFIHLSLILLFAFTQMGVATHEISHLTDGTQQHQQDQNNAESQCEQCLSYNHAAAANVAQAFSFELASAEPILTASPLTSTSSTHLSSYSARAPPTPSQA